MAVMLWCFDWSYTFFWQIRMGEWEVVMGMMRFDWLLIVVIVVIVAKLAKWNESGSGKAIVCVMKV